MCKIIIKNFRLIFNKERVITKCENYNHNSINNFNKKKLKNTCDLKSMKNADMIITCLCH